MVLAVGLAVAAALLFFGLFGESWQSRLAEVLAAEFKKKGLVDALAGATDAYWRETEEAFEAASREVEEKYREYVRGIHEAVHDSDGASRTRIEATLRRLEELRGFFAGIPLRSGGFLGVPSIESAP